MIDQLLPEVRSIARQAGSRIMEYYTQNIQIDYKGDDSPLTSADRAAHAHITESLAHVEPKFPILSEESDQAVMENRQQWKTFWLVDPLDGTKEFIKETGEFTVNIALIDGGEPILGVIYQPVRERYYFAARDRGAFRQEFGEEADELHTRPLDPNNITVVASRDHRGEMVEELLERLDNPSLSSIGSSIKFCLIAAGEADIYLRDVPTMEWDTGAAQCIVEEAGGTVTDLTGDPLTYNKNDLQNPLLVTIGDPSWDWQTYIPKKT